MADPSQDRPAGFSKFGAVKRQALRLSPEALVKLGSLSGDEPEGAFPLVVRPNAANLNLASWAQGHRELVEKKLLEHGVVLFRDFKVENVDQFQDFARAVSPDLLDYKERAAPRNEVASNVYTSTEFPPDQIIPMHHEMSYSHNWPTKLWFFCAVAPAKNGRTPIVDDRKLVDLVDPAIKKRFTEKKLMYVRNYGEGVDMTWREAFQTDDRAVVEEYARKSHMLLEWRDGDRLRARSIRQVFATHPKTGQTVWFNHAHMFHSSNLPPAVRAALLAEFAEDELPRNALYGDGSPIEDSILAEIRDLYEREAVRFDWHEGDVMLVDNFLASHGREPFEGPRKILVAMAELYENTDL
ncbi:MAG: TauD/TfdA family dioxygenase [Thermoanaerobaculia bacterium]|nr:TauD/TfdA family dioxygenase [Thermoanaerobaculia bacterium]